MRSIKFGVLAIFLVLFATNLEESIGQGEWNPLDYLYAILAFISGTSCLLCAGICVLIPAEQKVKKAEEEEVIRSR